MGIRQSYKSWLVVVFANDRLGHFKKEKKAFSFVLLISLIFLFCSNAFASSSSSFPPQAAEAGYTKNTFSSNFSNNDIDVEDTRTHGFNWYVGRFFGWKPTPPHYYESSDETGLVIKTGKNFSMATAARVKGSKRWVGRAFGGGGYFEAEIKFNPDDVLRPKSKGWPSFWAMSIEHMANLPEEQWAGQEKGYAHFIEVDVLEYLFKEADNIGVYGANIHDWYGAWRETCSPKQFCKYSVPYRHVRKSVPPDTDFNKYHKYGFLWIPATKETKGWGQFYFDDKPIGRKETWTLYEDQAPSMIRRSWNFGILDRQHLVLILGTGENQSMSVRSVNMWQKSDKDNWVQ